MKVRILVSTIILSFAVSCNNSDRLSLSAPKVDLNYQDSTGKISGRIDFAINGKRWSDDEIAIDYDEANHIIALTGGTQSADFSAPEWWSPLQYVAATQMGLEVSQNNPSVISIRQASVVYVEDEYHLSSLALNCNTPSANLRPLENCLQRGSLKISDLVIADSSMISMAMSTLSQVLGTTTNLQNLSLTVNNNSFDLTVKANLSISVNVKGNGKIEYLPEGDEFDLRIKVDKLKASFLNIKDDLFKELKKSESNSLKVQSPYIYISFSK